MAKGGNYYLADDIVLTGIGRIEITRNVSLCLNGHNISMPNNNNIGHFTVNSASGTLNLCNCQEKQDNQDSQENKGTLTGAGNGAVKVNSSGTFNMYGGTISNNTASSGGGVYFEYQKSQSSNEENGEKALILTDSEISSNMYEGICLNGSGTITLNGKITIKDNKGYDEQFNGDLKNRDCGIFITSPESIVIGENFSATEPIGVYYYAKNSETFSCANPINLSTEVSGETAAAFEEAVVLSDLDSDVNTLTIKTDKFSTYALVYSEKTNDTPSDEDSSGGNFTVPDESGSDGNNPAPSENEPSDGSNSAPGESEPTDGSSSASSGSEPTGSEDTLPENGGYSDSNTASTGIDSSSTDGNGDNSDGSTASLNDSISMSSGNVTTGNNNDNPSTGNTVSLIPFLAVTGLMIAVKRRRN